MVESIQAIAPEGEQKGATTVLNEALDAQVVKSNEKTSLLGTFWRKVAALGGASAAVFGVGKGLVDSQSSFQASNEGFQLSVHGGAVTGVGVGLVDAGLLGLATTLGLGIYGLIKDRRQSNGEKEVTRNF